MKKFEKLRIIEAGETANSLEKDGKTYKIVISAECFPSLTELGNARPIHARRTHNGNDLLDGYIGYFENFQSDDVAVYADLVLSEALEKAYPSEFTFMATMIEKEPELLGVSVNQLDVKAFNDETMTASVTQVTELFSADLVGLPAATSSLFNNNFKQNEMSKFFTKLASLLSAKKTELATETVTTKDGEVLTIIAKGESADLGDEVHDAEGNPVPDGDYYVSIGEGEDMILSVIDGKISNVKEVEDEAKREEQEGGDEMAEEEKPEDEKKTPTPEELSKAVAAAIKTEMAKYTAELASIRTQLGRKTPVPPAGKTEVKTSKKGETKLSREAVQAAFNANRKKW
nr:MAG TPA: hypothetical protein [Caudoviricetes sp.]